MIEPQAHKRGISVNFPRVRDAAFRQSGPDAREAGADQPSLQRREIQPAIDGSVAVDCVVRAAGRVRISVTDTGAGLTPDQVLQLFQPFNRLGQEAKSEEGTGIGLVVCKRLVEIMGGAIGAESIVGKGSVFWIELDLTAEPARLNDVVSAASVPDPVPTGRVAHAALCRRQPGQSDAGRGPDRASARTLRC